MADQYDLRIKQTIFPGWEIDAFPGSYSPDQVPDMTGELLNAVQDALDSGGLDLSGALSANGGDPGSGGIVDTITQIVQDVVQGTDFGPPAKPSKPTATPMPMGIQVFWDGNNDDGSTDDNGNPLRPADWDHCEVHASTTQGFVPDSTTYAGVIVAPPPLPTRPPLVGSPPPDTLPPTPTYGGQAVIATTDYTEDTYICLVAVCRSGEVSEPSDEIVSRPYQISNLDIAAFTLDVTKFRDDRHHLY